MNAVINYIDVYGRHSGCFICKVTTSVPLRKHMKQNCPMLQANSPLVLGDGTTRAPTQSTLTTKYEADLIVEPVSPKAKLPTGAAPDDLEVAAAKALLVLRRSASVLSDASDPSS